MTSNYQQVVDLNILLLPHISTYSSTLDASILTMIWEQIATITAQEASNVCTALGLSYDQAQDMKQEAFIKLRDVLPYYDPDRCPAFTAWWRRVIRNHLLTSYGKRDRFSELQEYSHPSYEPNLLKTLEIAELRDRYNRQVEAWNSSGVSKPLALAILNRIIFCLEDAKVTQAEIHKDFPSIGLTYISRMETYLLKMIRDDLGETYTGT